MTEDAHEPNRPDPRRRKGLIIVNTGDGKGKTTAALGLAFRALGSGFKVFMVQYIKGKWKTGEKKMADRLGGEGQLRPVLRLGPWTLCRPAPAVEEPALQIRPMGDGFTWDTKNPAQDIATTLKIWDVSQEAIRSGKYDVVILDEINVVMKLGYLDPQVVVDALRERDPRLHVVLTGRGAPPAIIELADLVSEVVPVKHPFNSGVKAQQGIEF